MSTDSGWNWTPSTVTSRCRIAMMTPVSVAGDLELVGHCVGIHGQRVVAGGGERIGQASEHALALVVHLARLAVQQLRGTGDLGAIRHGDGLQTQADTENRNAAGESYHVDTNPASSGMPGPGLRSTPSNAAAFVGGHFVIAPNFAVGAELRKVLHEVIDKRVVVVDNQDADAHGPEYALAH